MSSRSDKRPNFLILLADDLGYSDIGCFGAEIQTPHLDQLASEGVRLANLHTAAACSPTRAMIMTGSDAHLGGLGVMLEYKQTPQGKARWAGKAGYDGYLNKNVATVAEVLGDHGYFTAMAGKWHLGLRPDHNPSARGFQKSFAVLPGCCNHFGWEPVLDNGYPAMPTGGRPLHVEGGERIIIPPNKTEDPEGFYSSDYYTSRMIDYLEGRSADEREKPFFGYMAYSAPHWPCQAPKSARDVYKDAYTDGPMELRKSRLQNLEKLGLIPPGVIPHDVVTVDLPEWDDMTDYQRLCSSRAMAAYAGQVHQIDVNVGRLLDYLKRTGEYDNTFIVFLSDNGAEGAALEAAPVLGQRITEAIQEYYDNSPDNLGAWNSYCWIGPLWAQASTAPSRLYKCWPSQGGIHVPGVLKGPKGWFKDEYTCGGISRTFTTAMDFAPTFYDMAGIDLALTADGRKMTFRGNEVYAPTGHSWYPYFGQGVHADEQAGDEFGIYRSDKPVGWELFARAALRKGTWKIVHLPELMGGKGKGDEGWELFDLSMDPGETKDLSNERPDKLEELLKHWDDYVVEYGVVWGANADVPGISVEDAPLLNDSGFEQQRTWMQTPEGTKPAYEGLEKKRWPAEEGDALWWRKDAQAEAEAAKNGIHAA